MVEITLRAAMEEACRAIAIEAPRFLPQPGVWVKTRALESRNARNQSGRVMIFDDQRGGVACNWKRGGQQEIFKIDGERRNQLSDAERREIRERQRERQRRQRAEHEAVARICEAIVQDCRTEVHPYLERKGFPNELALVHDDPRKHMTGTPYSDKMIYALREFEGPLLVVPGRIGKAISTVQFITAEGAKTNIRGGKMDGASHRIATGRETWVAEGFATALTVRAALRLLGRSATVLSAFSASNAAKVASEHPGSILAADHDKPVPQFDGLGTGEFYARRIGHVWSMPPVRGDFNDYQESEGLRAVAVHLRRVAA